MFLTPGVRKPRILVPRTNFSTKVPGHRDPGHSNINPMLFVARSDGCCTGEADGALVVRAWSGEACHRRGCCCITRYVPRGARVCVGAGARVRSLCVEISRAAVVALPVVLLSGRRRKAADGQQHVRALASARARRLIARSYPRPAGARSLRADCDMRAPVLICRWCVQEQRGRVVVSGACPIPLGLDRHARSI